MAESLAALADAPITEDARTALARARQLRRVAGPLSGCARERHRGRDPRTREALRRSCRARRHRPRDRRGRDLRPARTERCRARPRRSRSSRATAVPTPARCGCSAPTRRPTPRNCAPRSASCSRRAACTRGCSRSSSSASTPRSTTTPTTRSGCSTSSACATWRAPPIRRLSGGQSQRLSLAAALIGRPRLVFLDEPTAGMDPRARADTWELVRGLRAGGTTVVLTTHYMDEAEQLCDRLAILDRGHIVAGGTPAEVTADAVEPCTRFTVAGPVDAGRARCARSDRPVTADGHPGGGVHGRRRAVARARRRPHGVAARRGRAGRRAAHRLRVARRGVPPAHRGARAAAAPARRGVPDERAPRRASRPTSGRAARPSRSGGSGSRGDRAGDGDPGADRWSSR